MTEIVPASNQEVHRALSSTEAMKIHDIADVTGRTVTSLRPVLRRMVADDLVTATAPPTSELRRYLRRE